MYQALSSRTSVPRSTKIRFYLEIVEVNIAVDEFIFRGPFCSVEYEISNWNSSNIVQKAIDLTTPPKKCKRKSNLRFTTYKRNSICTIITE